MLLVGLEVEEISFHRVVSPPMLERGNFHHYDEHIPLENHDLLLPLTPPPPPRSEALM